MSDVILYTTEDDVTKIEQRPHGPPLVDPYPQPVESTIHLPAGGIRNPGPLLHFRFTHPLNHGSFLRTKKPPALSDR